MTGLERLRAEHEATMARLGEDEWTRWMGRLYALPRRERARLVGLRRQG